MSSIPSEPHSLSDSELQQLAAFLGRTSEADAMTVEGMDGLFSALIASPDPVMPNQYLAVILGSEAPAKGRFESLTEANEILALIMRHWNSIVSELEHDKIHLPRVHATGADGVAGREWAQGFMRGVRMAPRGWSELFQAEDEAQVFAIALVAGEVDPQWPKKPLTQAKSDKLLAWMAAGLMRSYRHFADARRGNAPT